MKLSLTELQRKKGDLNAMLGFIIQELRVSRQTGKLNVDAVHKEVFGEKERMNEICICAAIKTKNGRIIQGHRHADCIYTARRMGMKLEDLGYADQGFVTSKNRYVSREEGSKLQDAAGIPSADHPEGYKGKTLFSEDLY